MHDLQLWPIGTAFGLCTIVLLLLTFFEGGGVGVRGKRLLYIVEGTEVQVPGMSYVCGMLVFLVCLINKWCLTAGSWVGAGV